MEIELKKLEEDQQKFQKEEEAKALSEKEEVRLVARPFGPVSRMWCRAEETRREGEKGDWSSSGG